MGRPTKDPAKLSRARDARRHRPWVELDGGPVPAPQLSGAGQLHPMARGWWESWVAFGEQAGFVGTDWERLQMVVLLVDDYWRSDDPQLRRGLLNEISRNERALSAGVAT
jgi:hypothetical protein